MFLLFTVMVALSKATLFLISVPPPCTRGHDRLRRRWRGTGGVHHLHDRYAVDSALVFPRRWPAWPRRGVSGTGPPPIARPRHGPTWAKRRPTRTLLFSTNGEMITHCPYDAISAGGCSLCGRCHRRDAGACMATPRTSPICPRSSASSPALSPYVRLFRSRTCRPQSLLLIWRG